MTGNSGGPMTMAKLGSNQSHDRGRRHSTNICPGKVNGVNTQPRILLGDLYAAFAGASLMRLR